MEGKLGFNTLRNLRRDLRSLHVLPHASTRWLQSQPRTVRAYHPYAFTRAHVHASENVLALFVVPRNGIFLGDFLEHDLGPKLGQNQQPNIPF